MTVAAALGALKLLRMSLNFTSFMWRHFGRPIFQPKNRILKTYGGEDTWAIVTGGSDGIGFAMALKLAGEGFNICIVSRSEKKINEKLNLIEVAYPNIKTKSIVADFSKLHSISDYQEQIGDKVKDLDIGVLALNAGVGSFGAFEDLLNDEVESMVSVNALHVVYTLKVCLNQMLERHSKTGKKTGVVVTSSGAAQMPIGGMVTYCATKTFVSFIASGLNFELKGKVDVMSYEAGMVSTNLLAA